MFTVVINKAERALRRLAQHQTCSLEFYRGALPKSLRIATPPGISMHNQQFRINPAIFSTFLLLRY